MGVLAFPVNTGIVRLSDCVLYRFNVDDIGTYPERKGIAYQLCEGDGTPITSVRFEFPKENTLSPLDFTQDVSQLLSCKLPESNSGSQYPDTLFKKDIILKYGEVVQSEEGECEVNTSELNQSAELITVINSYYQFDQDETFTGLQPLTDRPTHYHICKGSRDWLTVCGDGNVTMSVFYNNANPQLLQATMSGTTVLGVGDLNVQGNASGQVSKITYDVGGKVYTVCVKDCCCDCKYKLYFKEPKGSLTLLHTSECLEGMSIKKDGYTVCQNTGCENKIGDLISEYGDKYISCKNWLNLSFKVKGNPNCDTSRFYMAMAASSSFYVEVTTDSGARRLVGFIIDQKDIPTYKDEPEDFVISGYLAPQYQSH